MTMSSPVGPEGITLAQPIPVPTLTVLPPSSDTESWSRSPSPRLSRFSRHSRSHRSRTRTKKRNEEEQSCTPKRGKMPQIVIEETAEKGVIRHRSPSPSPSVATQMEGEEQGQDSPSQDLLLPPSRSWSRSPSPSRRSRWSLRSLLSRDSDWDSCSQWERAPSLMMSFAKRITDGRRDSSPLPGPAIGIGNRGLSWYLAARCSGVGHNGKLTSNPGTVDDGRFFQPDANRRQQGRRADITPL
ncbi:GRAM domain-containing protein 1A isoform X1 [Lates japonicus]|uniref:GRAM domain-containing protein 1A isoform X1 n=1 Tax=Lates japonicus TaxID=270547 RepID=A0AAD3NHP6_LATJO|nr:GRAM domain-containing protein 1A isoform X1 [Lates japonicus]